MPWFYNQIKIYLFVYLAAFYPNDNYSEGWTEQFQLNFAVEADTRLDIGAL